MSSGGSVRTELIEEDGESRYKIIDVIGMPKMYWIVEDYTVAVYIEQA